MRAKRWIAPLALSGMAWAGAGMAQQYLGEMVDKPPFAAAYRSLLAGDPRLPGWLRTGGTATPAESVTVHGRALQLFSACKPHDCPDEQILVAYDAASARAWGVFVRNRNAPDAATPDDVARTTLRWLGHPDGAMRNAMLRKLRFPE